MKGPSSGTTGLEWRDIYLKNTPTVSSDTDHLSIRYTEIIPVLIKAMQEQQEIIEAQQTALNGQAERMLCWRKG